VPTWLQCRLEIIRLISSQHCRHVGTLSANYHYPLELLHFDVRKAENNLQKIGNDTSFIVKKEKKAESVFLIPNYLLNFDLV
jgi:hypothetical protein